MLGIAAAPHPHPQRRPPQLAPARSALTAVALPGIVFAAGVHLHLQPPPDERARIHLYETTTLLVLGYLATALPSTSRVLLGSVGQVQESLREAGRVQQADAGADSARCSSCSRGRSFAAWVTASAARCWSCPVSQLLHPPDHPPIAVVTKALANYDYGGGTAMEVTAVALALVVPSPWVWGGFHLLAPPEIAHLGRTRDHRARRPPCRPRATGPWGGGARRSTSRHSPGIDLDVAAGQFLVLLGPSGSGKSTLVRSIAGIERLDETRRRCRRPAVWSVTDAGTSPRSIGIWPWSSRTMRCGRT